ncbi:MAG: hypothetical protein KF745_14120 [Phycisphaeraceae bacterium]|nr:hypothetical protein [Phycisphaeraceae bacterium]
MPAIAQWVPNYKDYSIERLGLFGPGYTGSTGVQRTSVHSVTPPADGRILGMSTRVMYVDTAKGQDLWVYTPGMGTRQVGLTGGIYLSATIHQTSSFFADTPNNPANLVAGTSGQYNLGRAVPDGRDAWVWDGSATRQIGLFGQDYTGSFGTRTSGFFEFDTSYYRPVWCLAGYSYLYTGAGRTENGQDAWVWTGDSTVQIGLVDAEHTHPITGFRYSVAMLGNPACQVAGTSKLVGSNGDDAWVWTGQSTQRIGLAGVPYQGSGGYRHSEPQLLNAAGQVAGYTNRITGLNTANGYDVWVWNGSTTQQIGFTGEGYVGSAGYQRSTLQAQNEAGQIIGRSYLYTGVNTEVGSTAWFWSGGTTTRIGLEGAGYRHGVASKLTESGQVAGASGRELPGGTYAWDAWLWDGAETRQIGLTGADYIGSEGYQNNSVLGISENGRVRGYAIRVSGVATNNGSDAWIWDGVTTHRLGLAGEAHTGSEGYRYSDPYYYLLTPTADKAAGTSRRYLGVNTSNGEDAWIWDGMTTRQVGLTDPEFTGSAGYQLSSVVSLNSAGQTVGYSMRISGVNTNSGLVAWYYDPATGLTTPIVGSVRTTDNYKYSIPRVLTEDGFLLGSYTYFAGGVGSGETRAFAFRPDIGFTDLRELITVGLGDSGWSQLWSATTSYGLGSMLGYGYVHGQTSGLSVQSQSVCLMTLRPCADVPGITASPSPITACPGGQATLSITTSAAGPFTCRWRKNTVPIDLAVNPTAERATLTIPAVSAADVASYDCVVTNACGTATSTPAMLTLCTADANCDGEVSPTDIAVFINAWFTSIQNGTPPPAPGDFDGNGVVEPADIGGFIGAWFAAVSNGC